MFEDVMVVVPARGGSVGIKDKNIQMLDGKPLFVHSVEAALKAGIPNENIIVSTDDKRILEATITCGVVPHHRPPHLATSTSPTELAVIDAWKRCVKAKTVITLQPTSPLRGPGLVRACLEDYLQGDFDSLLTATKLYDFFWCEKPVVESKKITRYRWEPSYDVKNRPMRQDLKRSQFKYFDNGNIYISDTEMLCETKCRVGKKPCIFPISDIEGLQIDTYADLQCFRAIFTGMRAGFLPDICYGDSYEGSKSNS